MDHLTRAGSTAISYDPLGLIASYGNITFTTDPLGTGNVLSDSQSGSEYIYGNGLEARVINGVVSYYVTDMRGSVVAIVNESGTITHKYQYDEFGKVVQKQEASYNPFQYVGKHGVMSLNDHLYYMRARHYDPTIGRFLSEDPIWSTNLYPYADNNPIMGIDPEGKIYSEAMAGIEYVGSELANVLLTTSSELFNLEAGVLAGKVSTSVGTAVSTAGSSTAAATTVSAGGGAATAGTLSSSVAGMQSIEVGIVTNTTKTGVAALKSGITSTTMGTGGMSAGATAGAIGCGVGIGAGVIVLAQDAYKAVKNAKQSDGFVDFIDKQNKNGGWLYKGSQAIGNAIDKGLDATLGKIIK